MAQAGQPVKVPNGQRISDGSTDWAGGVDSGKPTTIASQANPHGLKRNQLAWLESGTVRGGGISPRPGFQPLVQGAKWSGLFEGASMYEPLGDAFPYIMIDIGGRTYQVRVDTDNSVHDVSGANANPAAVPYHWFCQGEEFLIIQDGVSEPLVWNGTALRRISAMGGVAPYLPTGQAMAYANGRVAVTSGGRQYIFGDIVYGSVGQPGTGGTDNILHAAENLIASGGGALTVPTNAGNIRGFGVLSNINQPVSVGQLFVGTRKAIYAFNGGTQRFPDAQNVGGWIKTPGLQTIAQIGNGWVNDRSIVQWDSDLFFQTLEPGVRSLALQVRYANQWGNTPISRNENRVLGIANRALLKFGSGVEFNNRLLQTTLPIQTAVGVAHQMIMPLDFDIISSLEDKLNNSIFPAWEGGWEGLLFLQLLQGDFGGLQRAFAVVLSQVSNQIEIWEITQTAFTDNGDNRITWFMEFPALNNGKPFELKELETMELWYDELFGTVEFQAFYRPDAASCYVFWAAWKDCAARNCKEDPLNTLPCVYPTQTYCQQDRATITLPKPQAPCSNNRRPANIGYQHQVKLVIKGFCRIRGMLLHWLPRENQPFDNIVCANQLIAVTPPKL
jgi:hypothetical protein